MKKIIFGLLFTVLFLFAACNNVVQNPPHAPDNAASPQGKPSPGMGRLTINLAEPHSRTLLPQTPIFTRYTVEFTYSGGGVSVPNQTVDSLPFSVDLFSGDWTVKVTGYTLIEGIDGIIEGEYPAGSGEATTSIEAGGSALVTGGAE